MPPRWCGRPTLDDERNAELLRYYEDRTVWSIDVPFTDRDPIPAIDPALGDRDSDHRI